MHMEITFLLATQVGLLTEGHFRSTFIHVDLLQHVLVHANVSLNHPKFASGLLQLLE